MGMLIEDPVAVFHIAGVDVVGMEAFVQGGTVISQLHHLASELRALVDHHSVRALVLQKRRGDLLACRPVRDYREKDL